MKLSIKNWITIAFVLIIGYILYNEGAIKIGKNAPGSAANNGNASGGNTTTTTNP